MKKRTLTFAISMCIVEVICNGNFSLQEDPLGYNPDLEIVHVFYKQYPVGIAVSASGRKFICYPAGLDAVNSNNGSNNAFQVAELDGDSEVPYPNESTNNPPGGAVDFTGPFPRTKGLPDYFLGVQSVVIDFLDTLWVLDTGRVLYKGVLLDASPNGPKLVSIDLNNNTIIRIYTFPVSVAKPISYFSDVRFDTERGFGYIADPTFVQDAAIVVVDLQTGDSWRALERDSSVLSTYGFLPFIYGEPVYGVHSSSSGKAVSARTVPLGVTGVALSPDTETLYYTVFGGRFLFSVPTSRLRDRNTSKSETVASVRNLGERGFTGTITSDSLGGVYGGNCEQDGIPLYDPISGFVVLFARDKRFNYVNRFTVAEDGFLYFTVNQENFLPLYYRGREELGTDLRQKPYVAFRIKLRGNATKGPGS